MSEQTVVLKHPAIRYVPIIMIDVAFIQLHLVATLHTTTPNLIKAISHVIPTFYTTAVGQNVELTWEISVLHSEPTTDKMLFVSVDLTIVQYRGINRSICCFNAIFCTLLLNAMEGFKH